MTKLNKTDLWNRVNSLIVLDEESKKTKAEILKSLEEDD